ncbi:GNAT family N-acetyltransferase [Aquibacillus sp. 3ASR75-11]|uniref:GNAT family N-acetyltransferase n=1 Tax=Terrihalobacillus insolitus TaxID=2950438 RepID=A0A9X3WTQ7_9BACI|nr:GNAT family N-acetyltransferase [Terrihalobacillus insolitus]MDC3412802.1 GNAT family N-acetyltransferase [Terrihalobacillus insolitus]MDC3423721.1 GNAT family N-acetyltransferase [Terrihalobacillus insolitus]
MMDVVSSRITLTPITLEFGNQLLKGSAVFASPCITVPNDNWPSNGLKAILPYYLEKLESDQKELGFGPWIIKDKSKNIVVGEIGFKGRLNSEKEAEIWYYVVANRRRQGYATEAVSTLCHWAFANCVERIKAHCKKKNIASQKVLHGTGFTCISEDDGVLLYIRNKSFEEKHR